MTEPATTSLPMSEPTQAPDAQRTKRGRWKLLLLLLVTLAPVIASYFTYYVIRPQGENFYGQLISPQVELPDLEVLDSQGNKVNLRSLRGQWLLITVADAACDAACENKLYLSRQIHIGLGPEQDRLERVWLSLGNQAAPDRLAKTLEGATVLRTQDTAISSWLQPDSKQQLSDHFYLVDPQGFWMMRFPPDPDLKAAASIKKTLNRLMRAAKFWDRPGR
jgi:cytochrome oxidase Cu insertion factor (SCO1/SenC/PrrC family)